MNNERDQYINEAIAMFKEREPERFKDVLTSSEVENKAIERAKKSQIQFDEALGHSGSFGTAMGFVGQVAGGFTDPVNIAVTGLSIGLAPFTGGASTSGVATTSMGRSIISTILREAAVNAGTEALTQPIIADWQNEIGNEYGFAEMIENIGFAAIFGGTMGGLSRGVRPTAKMVFGKMASMKSLPKRVRTAAATVHRWAEIKEGMPYSEATTSQTKRHVEDLEKVYEAIDQGRPLDRGELSISEKEFNSIDTEPKPGDTKVELARKEEIKKFQDPEKKLSPEEIEKLKPQFTPETLPQQILDKVTETKGGIRAKDFAPEELEMLKSAGIEPNSKGQIKKGPLLDQRKAREKEGIIQDLSGRQNDHIKEYRDSVQNSMRDDVDIQAKEMETATSETSRQYVDDHNDPVTIAMEEKTFDDLLKANESLEISLDDGTVKTLKEISEEFADDERFLKEIIDCGVG